MRVMFWIHGGALSLGQAIEYIPTRYMDYDIVLVVIQLMQSTNSNWIQFLKQQPIDTAYLK